MLVVLGSLIVIGAVLSGFMLSGGHIGALIHPAEVLTIGGAALGALIVMSPKKVLIDLMRGVLGAVKGSPFTKTMYEELFKVSYDLLRTARRDGLMVLEDHVNDPHHSTIINKYPLIAKHHHTVTFLCNGLAPFVEGIATPEQMPMLLDAELRMIEEEHHAPLSVLTKTADALPGFGIVAAVLGIVITMGAIDGPVEEVGHKVGAALVGTFLGILASYGFFAPLAARMEFLGAAELSYFRTIRDIILAVANDFSPKVAIELARRGVSSEVRPERAELERMLKEVDASPSQAA